MRPCPHPHAHATLAYLDSTVGARDDNQGQLGPQSNLGAHVGNPPGDGKVLGAHGGVHALGGAASGQGHAVPGPLAATDATDTRLPSAIMMTMEPTAAWGGRCQWELGKGGRVPLGCVAVVRKYLVAGV